MAQKTDDASTEVVETNTTDLTDSFANLKTQLEADRTGTTEDDIEEEKDSTDDSDAEADNANDSDNSDGAADDTKDDNSEDAGDDNKDDIKVTQGSEVRFSQFKGKDGNAEEYVKNLENGYLESSKEALRVKDERDAFERQVGAIKKAATADPEFGEKLLGYLNDTNVQQGDGSFDEAKTTQSSNNPFLVNAETEWNQKNEKSISDFIEAHEEVITDPKINAEVKRWAQVYTREVYNTDKRLMTTGEAMQMAYNQLGYGEKAASEQSLVSGMKKNAAPTRPQAAKSKPSAKGGDAKQFSDLTLKMASAMGISKERLIKGSKR